MYETILFDLDGTLTDPGLGITNSVLYALEQMGYSLPPREALYRFIGPPLLDSFQQFYGMTLEQATRAIALYRVYFAQTGIWENVVYPGIPTLLEQLCQAGKRLLVATSKPQVFAEQIVEHFGLNTWISGVAGATMDGERTKKGQVIQYALTKYAVNPANALMVGDRKHDIIGAKENQLDAIGVLFGYGSREELTLAGASALAESPQALGNLILTETGDFLWKK